jgi:hypothetical protein
MYLINKFFEIIDAEIKKGVHVGHHIREFIQDVRSEDQLSEVVKAAWKSFKNATTIFFCANHKVEKDRNMVTNLVQSYKAMA